MPIIGSDKFAYFKPARGVPDMASSEIQAPSIVTPSSSVASNLNSVTTSIARETSAFGKQIQQQVDDSQYGEAVAEFTLRKVKRELEADQLTDYAQAPDYLAKKLTEDSNEISDKYITGQRNKDRFAYFSRELSTDALGRVSWRTKNKQVDELTGKLFQDISKSMQALNRSPQDWPVIEQSIIARVDDAAKNGLVSFEKAQNYKEGLQGQIDEMRVRGLMAEAYNGTVPIGLAKVAINDLEQFTRLSPTRRQDLIKDFDELDFQIQQRETVRQAKLEAAAAKQKKEEQDKTASAMWIELSKGSLRLENIYAAMESRGIDKDEGKQLLRAFKEDKGTVKDNPVIVGDLAERIAMGQDISDPLRKALDTGNITADRYISLKSSIGSKQMSTAIGFLTDALKPSEFDQWNPDKHVKHYEAVRDLMDRVSAGEKPDAAAREIIKLNLDGMSRTLNGLRRPRYLEEGEQKSDLDAIREAKRKTAEAFQSGNLSNGEYRSEIQILTEIEDIAKTVKKQQILQTIQDDDTDRINRVKKRNKGG